MGVFFFIQKLKTYRYNSMTILQYTDSYISFIPKFNFQDQVLVFEFTNETTKEVVSREPNFVGYQNDIAFASVEIYDFIQSGTFYNLKIVLRDSLEIILYKDRLYWTSNSEINTYSINEGQYTLPTIDNNDYITI